MCVFLKEDLALKSIEFSENDFQNLDVIAQELFINTDTNDPASINYIRHLERPKINLLSIICYIALAIGIFTLSHFILLQIEISTALSWIIPVLALIVYMVASLKKALICLIKIYQRLAPDSLRMKCRFEPSCSQYMILAIEKYGVLKGLRIGNDRLRRCKIGNGGYDFP